MSTAHAPIAAPARARRQPARAERTSEPLYRVDEACAATGANYNNACWYIRTGLLRVAYEPPASTGAKLLALRDVQALALIVELRRLHQPVSVVKAALSRVRRAGWGGFVTIDSRGIVEHTPVGWFRANALLIVSLHQLAARVAQRLARKAAV
jgi:hypothetical protein